MSFLEANQQRQLGIKAKLPFVPRDETINFKYMFTMQVLN